MAANAELKVRCPACGTKYKLPTDAVGRKVRCIKCQSTFRVTDSRGDSHRLPSLHDKNLAAPPRSTTPQTTRNHPPKSGPSEDDILQWLSEAEDDAGRERRGEISFEDPHRH